MTAHQGNLNKIMKEITDLGEHTPEYHDALAFLLTIMAKRQWIIADQIRRSRRDSEVRRERAAARKAAKIDVQVPNPVTEPVIRPPLHR